ncbi:leucine-rich repeat domain-containing protein [Psychrobacter sp. GP33]|uniref:leucine-rich repeat domain-containing protein n=1 Tax=Psychrobacter sp. GP33 TaxID=2758709 RepID=UPI0015FB92C0|nr:hypothetical protein [Psychrobacter sp. GP33]
MITKNTITIEPWITELWAWADKFEISEEDLPRNREGLLNIIDLDIRSNQLTELPESIGKLTRLRRLIVSKNQLDRLPDSIGQLINLECLDISDNPLTTLPESIVQLKELEFITIAEDGATNKLVDLSAEVTGFLRGLGHGCKGWSDTIKPIRSTSIQEYLLRKQRLNRNTVVDEDTDHIPLESIDREALQEVIKWAELCDLPSHTISRDTDELVKQTSLSIDSYTQPIPKAIGCLTQLRILIFNSCMSSGSDACQADDILPNTIANLINLETLRLVCNGLSFLPTNLHELKNLKTLEITFHDVTTIPKVLADMSCNIKLHLHGNQDKLPVNLLDDLADIRCLTELSTNDEHLTILPDNISQLTNLRVLNITSGSLKQIPQTIGALTYLTHLTLHCEVLEHLPESVGQFSQLEELIVISEKIGQLPDSLANLTRLRGLDIPAHLVDQLPIGIIERYRNNELWIKNIAFTKLYTPQMSEYDLSRYGFFLISDNWDEKSLIDLRFKTAPEFLLGLQTTKKTIKQFDVVDGIIICQPDEVQKVMNMFETTFNEFKGNDPTDIEKALSFAKPAKFIQASALEMSKSDQVLSQIIDQIPKDITIKDMMFKTESNRHFTFDEFEVISDTIDNMGVEDEHIFYSTEVVDKPKYCWMGMIYMVS